MAQRIRFYTSKSISRGKVTHLVRMVPGHKLVSRHETEPEAQKAMQQHVKDYRERGFRIDTRFDQQHIPEYIGPDGRPTNQRTKHADAKGPGKGARRRKVK